MTTYYTCCESPIGELLLASDGVALTALLMAETRHAPPGASDWVRRDDAAPFAEAKRQLAAYFAGERTEFDLPLAPAGTEFQRRAWAALQRIPYGETVAYGEQARRIGAPGAGRAVGLANGRNPIGIIVPCHRVIGANGQLVGYGGGLERKAALLAFERAVSAGQRDRFAWPGAEGPG
jgi:methylated-DNA-[protein]-cysteine S-methyltransferase